MFFRSLGFTSHPFVKTNADEEPQLSQYFVPPPFFSGVIGDPNNPSACIVKAPRGGGKTAQKRMVEEWAAKNGVLAVAYDRFEFSASQQIESVSLQYHAKNIIIKILATFLSYLSENSNLLSNLPKSKKKQLSIFVHAYLGDMTSEKFNIILNDIKSLPQKIRSFWTTNVGVFESIVNILLKNYGLEAIDLPELNQEEKKLSSTYKFQLELLFELIKDIGLSSIYVLIDKIDETEKTGNNAEAAYGLIRPLVKDLELLGLRGYGFKFFVWDKIEEYLRVDARPDRITSYQLSWKRNELENVLSKRLAAFSEGRILKFKDIVDKEIDYDIDSVICILANRSPRNVIRICEKILSSQAQINPLSMCIELKALEVGIDNYCNEVALDIYGEKVVKEIRRIGKELFTINFIASEVFKENHEVTSRNKVVAWTNAGAVKQICSIVVKGKRRPLNFYYICDPVLVRMIHSSQQIIKFFQDRWIACDYCHHDNLMDFGLFPENNPPICIECGRDLF
ncbi:MAG TPA: hypothetical protein PKC79_11585 [Solidesulfovibrio magneticus]|nr:hypothetical protein [Solidesulfovibrio magneticus]